MLRASLRQGGRRVAVNATTVQRSSFTTVVGDKQASALISKRRELAIVGQKTLRRSYAVAAEDTNKGVVCLFELYWHVCI